ncbi:membrane protein [Tepiditoga spiralis]|uniref:Membrane protein n=1 Tax=Tepiditoga spiralis TaxID=2108365 RepID=A0A7G1G176_9BACT|nr:hypothetical protein [Tepiditoga spiralis]BBE29878.1 membrane protein [Tepiditoga spiralis]
MSTKIKSNSVKKRNIHFDLEPFIFLTIFLAIFIPLGNVMGGSNLFKTLMATAHDLLLNTVFFIMAVAVLTGALGALFSEFGVVYLLNKILKPLMKPLYKLPGAASLGILTTYLSDNPAILSLSKDKEFIKYFERWQVPLLCNMGTAFGMGLIVTTFMIAQSSALGENLVLPVLIGNIGAIVGSVISVRIFSMFTKKFYGEEGEFENTTVSWRKVREGNAGSRFLDALLEGGKTGVDLGLSIIPGVLIISTFVMIVTYGPSDPNIGYQGLAYEGVPVLPWVFGKISGVLEFLFGFHSAKLIAFPLTSLGSTGAAMALIPSFIKEGILTGNDVAVFTALGMTWSGYLSTHIAMMDTLGARKLASKAILSHTIAGLCAGIITHYMYVLFL